jgi:hypothetical protein
LEAVRLELRATTKPPIPPPIMAIESEVSMEDIFGQRRLRDYIQNGENAECEFLRRPRREWVEGVG